VNAQRKQVLHFVQDDKSMGDHKSMEFAHGELLA
jgi:hypothetical protein